MTSQAKSSGARTVLVTGATSGIGKATALRLAGMGCRVVVHGRSDERVERVVSEVTAGGGVAVGVVADFAAGEAAAAVTRAQERTGGVDVLVNNVGAAQFGAFEELSLDETRALFEVNLFAAMAATRAILPSMRAAGYGRVVNVSSIVGWLPAPFMGVYAATKHALEGFTETLDHEVRTFGVRACTVQPGFTRTSIGSNASRCGSPSTDYTALRGGVREAVGAQVDGGGDPDGVARVIAKAVRARRPRPRYLVGAKPRILRTLRVTTPPSIFGAQLRKRFGLADTAVPFDRGAGV